MFKRLTLLVVGFWVWWYPGGGGGQEMLREGQKSRSEEAGRPGGAGLAVENLREGALFGTAGGTLEMVDREWRGGGAGGSATEIVVWRDEEDVVFPYKRTERRWERVDGEWEEAGRWTVLADRVLVDGSAVETAVLEAFLKAAGKEGEGGGAFSGMRRIRLTTPGIGALDRELARLRDVAEGSGIRVGKDAVAYPMLIPNDPQYEGGQDDLVLLGAEAAWGLETGSEEVVVGIIDTGMELGHDDLAGNLFVNAGEVAGNGMDEDGNGLIDDVSGWDFYDGDAVPEDAKGHGTGMAGLIGAEGNNGIGVAGASWEVGLLPLRAGYWGLPWSNIILAMDYAVALRAAGHPVKVLNLSLGGGIADGAVVASLEAAVGRAEAAGLLLVAAAGNAGEDLDAAGAVPFYPAALESPALVVAAASNRSGQLAEFSNYGAETVDLAVPGTNVLSTQLSNGYATRNGTSVAAARLSGVAALLASHRQPFRASHLRALLLETGTLEAGLIGKLARPVVVSMEESMLEADRFPEDPFAFWRYDHWGSGYAALSQSHADADPDGDGWKNLWEYAVGGDPRQPFGGGEATGAPEVLRWVEDGQWVVGLSYRLRTGDEALHVELESGALAGEWFPVVDPVVETVELEAENYGFERRLTGVAAPAAGEGRFLRLRVRREEAASGMKD